MFELIKDVISVTAIVFVTFWVAGGMPPLF